MMNGKNYEKLKDVCKKSKFYVEINGSGEGLGALIISTNSLDPNEAQFGSYRPLYGQNNKNILNNLINVLSNIPDPGAKIQNDNSALTEMLFPLKIYGEKGYFSKELSEEGFPKVLEEYNVDAANSDYSRNILCQEVRKTGIAIMNNQQQKSQK